ncbi:hypothetical protein [Candidatus Reidiella endopervernicosa]|uniref:Uncharacterized protein n=2 Tax=Gammaproteobacteria incertae sedis TaxID=118884 RepID=A0A6N0HZ47_9GAMM|nr:hypothetical protein [Candidatus Reidiella endopervernicosa]QKQ27605.1 hypothetical protein HUE57_15890 [Candidatus Reidiella endopervernicosa]
MQHGGIRDIDIIHAPDCASLHPGYPFTGVVPPESMMEARSIEEVPESNPDSGTDPVIYRWRLRRDD